MIIIQVAGRLGRDPESRFTPSGQKVVTLTLATNVRKGGKDETVWWRVTIWGDRFDKMISYLKKGSAIIAIGEMHKPEIWTDKEGRPQVSMEMTADILRFSPFGNPDQKIEQASGNAVQGHGNYGQSGGESHSANQSAAANHSFASPNEFSSGRQTHSQFQNEDPLPF